MNPRIRKLAVLVGTTAALGGAVAGCGTGSSSSGATAGGTSTTQSAQAAPGQSGGGPGGLSTTSLKTLATKLGVTTTALQKAMQSARPAGQLGQGGSSAPAAGTDPQTQMATAIAKSLNLSTAKVAAALKAVMPAAPSGAPPSGTAATS